MTKLKDFLKRYKLELVFLFFFVLLRLPDLGHDNFNTDVWKWKARTYDFGTGVFTGQFEKTLQKYHPGVTLMWIGTAGVKIYNGYYQVFKGINPPDNDIRTIFELDFVQKLLIVIVTGITLSIVFASLKRSYGKEYASIGMYLVSIEPLFLGMSRVIHLEGLLTTFLLASFVLILEYKKNGMKMVLFSGFFAGLAILTKSTGIYSVPLIGLLLFMQEYFESHEFINSLKLTLKPLGAWIGIVLIVIFVFWPVLWVNPLLAFNTLVRGVSEIGVDGGHAQIFFGQLSEDPGLLFYPVVLLFKISISSLIGLFGLLFIYKKLNENQKKLLMYLGIFAISYFVMLQIPSKKIDRYILPCLVSVTLMASIFFQFLYERIKFKKSLIFLTILVPSFLSAVSIHPDYFAYNNQLFGGTSKSLSILEPKWLIGKNEIVKSLVKLKTSNGLVDFSGRENIDNMLNNPELNNRMTVGFQEKYYTQIWPFIREIGAWPVIQDLSPYAVKTKYFIYPVWDDESVRENRFKLEFVETVKIDGVSAWNIYKRV